MDVLDSNAFLNVLVDLTRKDTLLWHTDDHEGGTVRPYVADVTYYSHLVCADYEFVVSVVPNGRCTRVLLLSPVDDEVLKVIITTSKAGYEVYSDRSRIYDTLASISMTDSKEIEALIDDLHNNIKIQCKDTQQFYLDEVVDFYGKKDQK